MRDDDGPELAGREVRGVRVLKAMKERGQGNCKQVRA